MDLLDDAARGGLTPPISRIQPDAFVEALVHGIPDPVFAVTVPGYRLAWFNQAAQDFLLHWCGTPPAIGAAAWTLAADAPMARQWRQFFQQASHGEWMVPHYRAPGDGRVWQLHFYPIRQDGACAGVSVVAKDISAHEDARQKQQESDRMYRSLFNAMGEGAVFQEASGRIVAVNAAAELIEGRSAAQLMGMTSDAGDWDAVREDGSPFPGAEHPAMVTLRTGLPQAGVVMGIRRPDGERRWLSINSQPVLVGDGSAPQSVVSTFHDITGQRALADTLRQKVQQLDAALEQTLVAVSTMVEMRDPYTAGHEHNVGIIAADIGAELGWSPERCRLLKLAGLVHDIGKIAIPAEILVKPRRLTELEYQIVRQHVDYGYAILKEIEYARPIAEIVRAHHERLDGSGYPLGLKGEQILPEARVLAVADVLESMASHRPYRPARGMNSALAELQTKSGSWYDPEVVAALLRMLERGYELPAVPE